MKTKALKNQTESCRYCGGEVPRNEIVPAVDDDRAWKKLAKNHGDDCEWIRTRAYRLHQEPK